MKKIMIAAITAATMAAQQSGFERTDIPVSGSFLAGGALTSGDFNGDGRPDLVVIEALSLSIRLNRGEGRFERPVVTPVSSLTQPVVGDFNGDGKADLIVIAAEGSFPTLYLLPGRGD